MLLAAPLTSDQIAQVRLQYLTDPSATVASLAQAWSVPTYRIASLLKGKAYEQFKTAFQETMAANARDKLQSASENAAELWVKSMVPAAAKGDHRPMKDLLAANRVIDLTPTQQSPVIVQIGIAVSDVNSAPAIDILSLPATSSAPSSNSD